MVRACASTTSNSTRCAPGECCARTCPCRADAGRWSSARGGEAALEGEGGELRVVLGPDELVTLLDQAREGVEREGPPRLTVEKDFLPEHLAGA